MLLLNTAQRSSLDAGNADNIVCLAMLATRRAILTSTTAFQQSILFVDHCFVDQYGTMFVAMSAERLEIETKILPKLFVFDSVDKRLVT
jgi:hypothetical protein